MDSFFGSLRHEGKALLLRVGIGRPGGSRTILVHVVLLVVFGIFLPWMKGLEFTDPAIVSAYLCMSVVFAAPSAAEAFSNAKAHSNDAPQSLAEASARIAVAVFYGEVLVATMLVAGMATVVLTHPHAGLFPPDLTTLAGAGLLGISASFALAAAAAWITLRFSANAARSALRVIFLALLLMFYYWSRWLPDFARTGALLCVVLGIAMLLGLRSVLHRAT
jgi:hypothetical protein